MKESLSLMRLLANEIRHNSSKHAAKNSMMMEYVVDNIRAHKETTEVFCKAREELHNLAENYLCYLRSLRKYNEIQQLYNGKGERSIKETANLVGFKLPHDP